MSGRSIAPTHRAGARPMSLALVVTLIVALTLGLSVGQLTLGADRADAATINVAIQSRMFNQSGWTGASGTASPQNGDYFRYGSNTGATTGVIANPGGSAGTNGSPLFNTNGYS